MAEPAEQQEIDAGADLKEATAQAIEACGGDARAAVSALIVANAMLEQELSALYAKASKGFLRGRRVVSRVETVSE